MDADTTRPETRDGERSDPTCALKPEVVRLLRACDVPVASTTDDTGTPTAFEGRLLPYRVVVRREAHGSFLKRNPHVPEGYLLPRLAVEFFLSTQGRRFRGHEFGCEAPLLGLAGADREVLLFDPGQNGGPFLALPTVQLFEHPDEHSALPGVEKLARQTFLVLEKAWQLRGEKLVELELEFELDADRRPLISRHLDATAWHVLPTRQTGVGAEPGLGFHLPDQRILLWRGSSSDPTERFSRALGDLDALLSVVTCSAHKEPVAAAVTLHRLVHEVPDTVIVAYIGRSNGAGPTLSAMSTVPVITVPASVKDFPDDVWSSLRAPSKVPVMTVLEPENAVLAALQILSARNPRIYARIRAEIEARLVNVVMI